MLACNVELDQVRYPVLCTPKFDGIRCIIQNGVAVSRTLKPIPNLHIQQLLSELPSNLDGELIVHKKTFNQIQSEVMREDGEPDVTYYVFDIIDTKIPYRSRMDFLRDVELPSFCKKVLPVEIDNEETLKEYEEEAVDEYGFEGIMIRDPEGPYKYGRSTAKQGWLCKLKRFSDDEAKIVGYEELFHNENEATLDALGHTKRSHKKEGMVAAGTLGAWILEKNGKRFKVATGMTMEDRAKYWETREEMIGQWVKYKHQESGAKDLPRFPVFLGIRHPDDM